MTLRQLEKQVVACRKCRRLVQWREKVAREKVKRFADCTYWGKPCPGFGDPNARVLLIGLAPAAHGGNRTGRMFTGDRSGDWLFRTLHHAGFANQPESKSRDDGLKLNDCYISATCRCAPPKNTLLPSEIRNCRPYLLEEFRQLKRLEIIIGLGKVGFDAAIDCLTQLDLAQFTRKPKFGHGAGYRISERLTLIGSFHPSQQNTFTGRLTQAMFDSIFLRAKKILGRQ